MIEAVENHTPQCIVIDEIGTLEEVLASRTIAERGVRLLATAHGGTLENLLRNPTLNDLVGGVHTVTLGDMEAARRQTTKSVLERKGLPTFDVIVEIVSKDEVRIHRNVEDVVDAVLRGLKTQPEIRVRTEDGWKVIAKAIIEQPKEVEVEDRPTYQTFKAQTKIWVSSAVNKDAINDVISDLRLNVGFVPSHTSADILVLNTSERVPQHSRNVQVYRVSARRDNYKLTKQQATSILKNIDKRPTD
jgi:hypothetical protein